MTERDSTASGGEDAVLAWLESTGWQAVHGPDIAPDMFTTEHADYSDAVLARRLNDALVGVSPALPRGGADRAVAMALDALTRVDSWESRQL